jgi:hypothetical protein
VPTRVLFHVAKSVVEASLFWPLGKKNNSSATTHVMKDFCENNALKLPDFEKILSQVFFSVTILRFLRKKLSGKTMNF